MMSKKLTENAKKIELLQAANNHILKEKENLMKKIDTLADKNAKLVSDNLKLKQENDDYASKTKLLADKMKKKDLSTAGNSVRTDNTKKHLNEDTTGENSELNR